MAKATVERACEQCGATFTTRPIYVAMGNGRFCSRPCRDAWRRTSQEVACEVCHQPFKVRQYRIRQGSARFCSVECMAIGYRKQVECACQRCGKGFTVWRSEARRNRKYCSRACFLGHPVDERVSSTCAHCGKLQQVVPSHLAGGKGRYCSLDCYRASRPARRTVSCAGCEKSFTVKASQTAAKYCSRPCYWRAKAGRVVQCLACGKTFRPRPWYRATARYCSNACTNRGRQRSRKTELVQRDQRLLELRGEGLDSARIARHLAAENASWPTISAAGVRKILSRVG